MAKKAYIGVDGVARKVKGGYIGVDNIARKIKKAYIGIGGVARPCWSGSELVYYGAITPLSTARWAAAATNIGDYVVFGGGYNGAQSAVVDAYSKTLERSAPSAFTKARCCLAAATVSDYAIFGGGMRHTNGGDFYGDVDVYDTTLTKYSGTVYPLRLAAGAPAATSNSKYALIGGGDGYSGIYKPAINAYDSSLSLNTSPVLSKARGGLAAATVGDYALFGGGKDESGVCATVDVYDASLTRTSAADLSSARSGVAATSTGKYAFFGGGIYNSGGANVAPIGTVDVFDASLTHSRAPAAIIPAVSGMAATAVGDYAIFCSGNASVSGNVFTRAAHIYDDSLTKTILNNGLNVAKGWVAAATVENYALFGGGLLLDSSASATVDAFVNEQ